MTGVVQEASAVAMKDRAEIGSPPPTSSRRRRFHAVLVALATVALACPLAAESAPDVRRATAEAIGALDLQLKLPRDPEAASWHFDLPPELQWAILACGGGLLLYLLVTNFSMDLLPIWRRRRWQDDAIGAASMAAQPAAEAVVAADELARQGSFVEAMHMLLLQSLAEIRLRLGEHFADSLTSWEILRSTRLSAAGRVALREIITRVQWTYFGEHPAGFAEYAACRERFNELSHILRGGAAHE
jgi:hypothetical protein